MRKDHFLYNAKWLEDQERLAREEEATFERETTIYEGLVVAFLIFSTACIYFVYN
jgi:hypothetical protein